MRNSRDKSNSISRCSCMLLGDLSLTVDPLLICKSLTLLRLVPFNDKAISEGEGCARVGSTGDS
jgi:hypothetical protein